MSCARSFMLSSSGTMASRSQGQSPFIRRMLWQIVRAPPVGFSRATRYAKIADQMCSIAELLGVQLKYRTDSFQRQRKCHICGPHHRATPCFWIQIVLDGILRDAVAFEIFWVMALQPVGQTDALEGRIKGPLNNSIIGER